ncbi:uncharacterized protein [Phyllobates terribilis]|uniref:uncharacterized protein n=1 Tax=Phyllobates terribilis TaxID=111132 RepID=UPI003CCAAB72
MLLRKLAPLYDLGYIEINLEGGNLQLPNLNVGGSLGQQGGKIEFGSAGEAHAFGINGNQEINGGLNINGINQDGGGKINLEGGNLQLPNLNVGGSLGQQGGKFEFGSAGEAHSFGINGNHDINGGFSINGINQEGGGKINLESGNLQLPNLNGGGSLGQQGGKIEFGSAGEAHAFGINGQHEINGGFNINGINQDGGGKINLEGGNLQLPNLNVGGSLGQQGGKFEFGSAGEAHSFGINGNHDINGGFSINGINQEGGDKINLESGNLQLPNLNGGGSLGQQGGKIEFGSAGEAHAFGINGQHEINGGFNINGINQDGGGKINLEGGNLQLPNLNVGGSLGQQGGKIEFGSAGEAHSFGINGNHDINGGFSINGINQEGGGKINLESGNLQLPNLNGGGSLGQQGGKIEFGSAGEAHAFGINGQHEINGGFNINGINQDGGGKINLEGGNLQLPNLNVGGSLGQQGGKIEFGSAGDAHSFGINGNRDINGGFSINGINQEGGGKINLESGNLQLPNLNVGGIQGGKIEFGSAGEAHAFGINGQHEINGGFNINGINQEGGGKINLEGGNLQIPNLNVGGTLGQQGGKIEFGSAGEAHAFGINGNHEINGGLDISSVINRDGGKQIIDLSGRKIPLPDLHLGGAVGQQGGKIEFGSAGEAHSFGINGNHDINGGFSINGINQEGGKINLESGNLQLPNLNVGGIQGGKIEFGSAGDAHAFGINGQHEINGGFNINGINQEGGGKMNLEGGNLQIPNLNVGGTLGQQGGKIEFGSAGEAHAFGINGNHEINGGLDISSVINREGGKQINVEGGNLQLPNLNVGGTFGQQGGKIEFGSAGEAHAFGINGNHEINGGFSINGNNQEGGGKINLGGGNLQLPNQNVGGILGQQGGKIEFGSAGEAHAFGINGNHEINGGFSINGINHEGGGKINVEGGNLQLPNLNVGGTLGQQGGKIEFGSAGEAHAFGINGNHEINGGFSINGNNQEGGGKINLGGGNLQLPNLNVGGILGQQGGKMEFGSAGEAHAFGINGNHEINGGFSINGINHEGGGKITLEGENLQLPNLNVGGTLGQQGGKIEFGSAGEAHAFGINGNHEINGGFSINGNNQEGGGNINLGGGNLQLPNLNVGGILGQQGGKIEFGSAGDAHAFGINGNHEINGGLDISSVINREGGKQTVDLKGGSLNVGGLFGQRGGTFQFGNGGETKTFEINGKHEINGGLQISGQEGGQQTVDLKGGNLNVGGLFGQRDGKFEFSNGGETRTFEINGKHEINGGLQISGQEEGGQQTVDLKGGNLNVGGLFGQHGGKFEFGNGGETRTFEIHGRHEFNGGVGESSEENKSEGQQTVDLKGGNLNVGGLFGQHGGKFEFGNGGETRTFEIHGRHEFNGGVGESSEENKSEGQQTVDLKGGNLNVGGLFGQHGGKFEFGNGGETRTFEIHGNHEFNVGVGESSEENKSEGQLDLKGGNLNMGGLIGHQNGKFQFGNGGETRTFDIHGRHEFNGGFGTSFEENKSEGQRFKFGGKFGYGHGSIEEHGKIDVNIKGRNKGSSEEKSSEEQKGNFKFGGKFSHERGGHGKGRSSESSEEDNSEEHEGENPEPEVPINPAPEGSVAPNLPVEPEEPVQPEVPVNTPEPEAPVQPEIPVNTPEPEAPDQPEIPVNTPEPEAPVQPEIPVNTPEPEAPVQPEIPVNTPEPEAPVQPEIPVNTPEPEAPIQPEISVPESSPSNGKSCTFNAQFVLHGQTVELACSTCTCNDGSLTCVKNLNCPGICSVIGLQMIRTFDGTLYNSPGNCDYVLAKTSDFTISLENELCSDLGYNNYNPDAICIKSVEIYIPQKASLKLLHDGTIQSTGEAADLPYSILDTITVLKSSSVFLDVASPLFNIQYDWVGNRLYVILDPSYKGQTAGLCGTYNDNRNDDYRSANDMTETVSSFFSKSWKTQYQCSEDTKDPEDIGQKADADWVCSDALDNSLFEDCALLIDTHSYKISCSSNVYYLNENEGLCAALADYAYRCARAGIFAPVSSSFPDCIPACRESMVAITEDSLAQHDCAEYTSTLLKITSSIPLNEVCICPSNLYYDSSLNECVKGDYCPCYSNNHLYKLGDTITQANGQTCPCERITQCGDREETPPEPEPCPDNEKYADCQFSSGTLCEPSCMNLAIIDQGCTLECTPGCVCKPGLMRSSEGNCVPLNECTCTHGDDIYVPGATLAKDCNTCTCENGKFSCTHNPCNKVCNAYGGSQFFLFDNVWKSFDTKHCGIVLVESRENETPFFRVVMQNTPNEAMGGALLKKTIYIAFGGASVVLSEFDTTVAQELGSNTQVKIYRSGFYQVAQFLGLTVYYDQHLDVIIQLAPQLQGKVQGMCGDADGTTTTELAISNMAQYASQFLTEECPDQQSTLPPPSDNHKKFVETRCSLLKGDDFSECHTVVNVDPYYVACVEETEACREGESCLCYCTALAAYARACCRKGITIDWRSPDTCPSPCEYYNRDGGEGPYRIVMMNGKTLVIDYENNAVSLENVDVPGDLKASFMVTSSLYVDQQNGRKLISLESAQHHNYFIVQNDDQTLSLRKWQPSVEFRKRATFILRSDRWVTGYDALESYSLRGLYLSIYGEALVMSKVKSVNMLQMNFKLIEESFGLPSFSICTWKYRSCGSPCIPTCQDPLGTKCTLTLKVEGCYPICAPEMVFDEVTHRCVQFADCVTPPVGPYTTPIPTSPVSTTIEPCRNVICKTYSCADGEYPQEVPSSDPCCPKYVCTPILPPVTTQPPTKSCSDVECKIEPCADGEYLQEVPSTDPCCQKYVCVPISSPATTGPPTVEPCRNVVCEPPVKCTKNGADLAEIPWDNICCPRYECQCQVICDPLPICRDSSPPLRIGDPNVDCCPAYECIETPPTTPPIKCAGVDCPTTVCTGDGNLVEVPSEDPCCQAYECSNTALGRFFPASLQLQQRWEEPALLSNQLVVVTGWMFKFEQLELPDRSLLNDPKRYIEEDHCPILWHPQNILKVYPEPVCDGVTCAEYQCPAGQKLLVKQSSDDPCCASFDCVPTETTPPPVWTPTPGQLVQRKAKPKKINWSISCDVNVNKCRAGPGPNCGHPAMSTYKRNVQLKERVARSGKNGCWMSTVLFKCDNVVCQTANCFMTGSKPVQVFSDGCCPEFECECEPCSPVPSCNGNKPIMTIDPEMDCCPSYRCQMTRAVFPKSDPQEKPTEHGVIGTACSVLNKIGPSHWLTDKKAHSDEATPPPRPKGEKWQLMFLLHYYNKQMISKIKVPTTPEPCRNVVCEPPVKCTKNGADLAEIPWDNICCPRYECQCQVICDPLPICRDSSPPFRIGDPDVDCCPAYECIETPPTTPPIKCAGVDCPTTVCTGDGNLVEVPSEDPCCQAYECKRWATSVSVQSATNYSKTKEMSQSTRNLTPDSCSPSHWQHEWQSGFIITAKTSTTTCSSCLCSFDHWFPAVLRQYRNTSTALGCLFPASLQFTLNPLYFLVQTLLSAKYEELPNMTSDMCQYVHHKFILSMKLLMNLPPQLSAVEKTPTPNVCDGVTCAEYQCPAGQKLLVKQSSDDPCCASFDCVPTETTPPPVWTPTPGKCDNVVCQTANCFMTGSKPVQVFSDGCCPEFECECEPCSPVPSCNGNKPIMTIDPEMDCCPSYRCPDEATPPPRPVPTTPAPTTPEPCKDVLCEAVTCEKKGSSLDIIPWAESCCTHFVCTCKEECDPIPICFDGRPAVRVGDPDTECCPSYNCEPPLPPCANVICPDIQCPAGLIPIEYAGDDPCCRQRDCVPVTPVPVTSPTTPGQCFGVTCIKPECGENEKQIVKVNSNDPCCPSYDCIPPPTPPSSTPEIPNNCDHECPVIDCFKVGASEEYVGGDDPCCPDFKCVCQPCNPAPTCGDNSQAVVTEFDPNSECCPTYDCQFKPETTTPIFITTPIPTPDHCSNILCEPVVCTKKGATVLEYPWANDCCPHYVCECTQACSPIPQCQDGTPPIRTQDPKSYCCPDYICQQPTPEPTTPEPCADIPCFVPPCDSPAVLVEVPGDDHCCKNYECIPPMTPPPTTTPEICDESLCEPSNCDEGDRVFVKAHPEGGCCPVYQCIPPSTLPPETTPTPDECENVVCRVEECTKQGSYAVSTGRDECCETYSCVCQPCSPAPICENLSVTVNADTQCCPIYACPPPPPTPTIPITTPPNPCENSVCEAVTCTKQGATAERREWADPCCQLFVCECTEECSPPPVCQDGRPPFRTQDPEHYCCPEFACLPPTTEPIVTRIECEGVTCTIPPCYGDYFLSEVASNDPCCRSYECNPLATTPPPTPPVPPCDGSGCSNIDCEDGYTKLTKHDPDDDCCPIYECIPPPTLPPTPPTPHGCERVECNNVEECTREGAVPVLVDWENECCPIYECECQPCSPAPVCENPFVDFDSNTQCCPSYACPPPTPSPTPEEPCSNRVCESITCTKHGATAKRIEWADPCCPLFVCECTEECSPVPECPDGTPPLRTQDSELYCCPEYECVPPTPVSATPGNCEGVTCTTPSCFGGSTMIRVPSKDPCCDGYECIPPPEPPTPTPPVPPCDGSGCSNIDCEDGYTKLTKRDPDDDCCPIYECIPPPTSPPTPPTPHGCEGIICNREECPREGAVSVAVDWEDKCCPIYECQCQLCIPPLSCNDENLVVHFDPNIQCCPVYECAPPTPSPPSPTPKPNPCENRVCEPLTCTKQGASLEMKEWADPCCPLFVCECTEECSPVPECSDGTPPLRTQDPESYCCPEYECVPPTPVPVTPGQCDGVTCTTPSCFGGYTLIRVPPKDPCCEGYECIPPTTSVPPTPKPPCDASGCEDIDCGPGYTKLTKHDPDDDCCPIYECIPPPTSPPEPTPDECRGVVCNVKECTKDGAKAVVVDRDNCCDVYECECQPCNAVPYCDGQIPYAAMNPDTECCPTYECPPPLPPTPTIPITTTPNPCENRVCEPVTCTKQGATLERREWADPCCPLYVCECTEECSPLPVCQDGRPPFRTQDTESYCCPEYACLPPTSEPLVTPRQCEGVTCAIEPCYGDYSLIEVSSNDPCCRSYECIPPPTTMYATLSEHGSQCMDCLWVSRPELNSLNNDNEAVELGLSIHVIQWLSSLVHEVDQKSGSHFYEVISLIGHMDRDCLHNSTPLPPITSFCDGSGCAPSNCDDGDRVMSRHNPDDDCCPIFECIPPSTTPIPRTTPPPENCKDTVCEVTVCSREGEIAEFISQDECCEVHECRCQPCSPTPICDGGQAPYQYIDINTQCCPSYECPLPTPPPETPPPIIPTSPENPCSNRLCEPVLCTKVGATVSFSGWIDECCPQIICECKQLCDPPPTCENGLPPFRTQDPEEYCCPEYVCITEISTPQPTTTLEPPCEGVTCFSPTCESSDILVEIAGNDPCCKNYVCVPPITNPPPLTPPICDVSQCPPTPECSKSIIVKPNPDYACCPIYECRDEPTPNPIISTPSDCVDISCDIKQCTKEGETPTFVGWLNACCRDYECQCQPCHPTPTCDGRDPIASINPDTQCCPTYECRPPPTTEEPPTTIIRSTAPGVKCEDRECPVKVCGEQERLVSQINPADPCCPLQTCECSCKTIPSCESDERLVAVQQSNQCCPKLRCEKKRDECYAVPTHVTLSAGHCSAEVILSSCSGYCHSYTEYSDTLTAVSQCRCCSVTRTQAKTFELPCQDGSKISWTVQEASECGCNKCSEEDGSESGSGSGSGGNSGSGEEEGSGFSLWSSLGIAN